MNFELNIDSHAQSSSNVTSMLEDLMFHSMCCEMHTFFFVLSLELSLNEIIYFQIFRFAIHNKIIFMSKGTIIFCE